MAYEANVHGSMEAHLDKDKIDELVDHFKNNSNNGDENMTNDIAGLMALMQGNRNLDLPGMLALCKERGYDTGWGNGGMGLLIILLFFLMFNNGGWGNNRNADYAQQLVGAENCNHIIGLHDRISAAQAASTQGFFQLDTKLCSAIAEVIANIGNQGDRLYNATRNVQDEVKDCCCALNNKLDTMACEVKGLYGHTSLLQERTANALQAMECRLDGQIVENRRLMELGFERLTCKMDTMARDEEIARLARENCALKAEQQGNAIADAAVARLQTFAINHYTPTRTATTTPAA